MDNVLPFNGKIKHESIDLKRKYLKDVFGRLDSDEIESLVVIVINKGDTESVEFIGDVDAKRALPTMAVADRLVKDRLFSDFIGD